MIQLARPWIDDGDCAAVSRALKSGMLVQGPEVAAFERLTAEVADVDHAVATSSGTAALHLTLAAEDVGPKDVVFVPAFSFTATANVVSLCNARVWFVDVDPETFCMSPAALAGALARVCRQGNASGGRLFIMPVHAFGQCAPMEDILRVAEEYAAVVIEDAACALGATRAGRPAGAWGKAGCFSFHPMKIVTTGEGGMVVTSDGELARSLRLLRNHGMVRLDGTTDFLKAGFNYRMSEPAAALGSSQMRRFRLMLEERSTAAAYYDAALSGTGVRLPRVADGNEHVFQSYVVVLPERVVGGRQRIIEAARADGVELGIGTFHIPGLTSFLGTLSPRCPVSATISARTLALPIYHGITEGEQDRVVRCLRAACGKDGE
jgi:dTDP-4-amino-4,6-dideoxygalactose transaminase